MTDPPRVSVARGDSARTWMRRALALARRGWGQTAPNPMVGAVVVRDGKIVGEGLHARFGGPHAEIGALAAAGDLARGAEIFVTLEPCDHHGKTPPCVDALISAGVRHVVAAVRDPGEESAGGAERLAAAGITVEFGLEEAVARELNAPFFFQAAGSTRPWVTLKLAVSLDAAIADASRATRQLSGEKARTLVHRLRAQSDAVAVGIGTVLADNPLLTVRHGRRPRVAPLRVVFDRTARLPLDAKLVKTAGRVPVLVLAQTPAYVRTAALEAAGVTVERVPGLHGALQALHRRGVRAMLVEGGAGLSAALLAAGMVDRLIIFQSPVLLGEGALPAFGGAPGIERLRVIERRELGDDLMSLYAVSELPPAS
ncbi:MAG TPA: bifunctional diaminohydroxyphosphoribosylaminopyrimidine deaminase/5-amino-6-(5-phosphoribosylamino)uracil reductase RibD [Gemmatimonadaceae bacterium]|nr:bifunctional diaminohydroxyphosphoribosylaminopyrimidine deaminase/5-amino-6-(5-phosphoribosylamino)uracil reductase RibD [Gemmatimonadaceae bacterium]